MSLTQEVSKIFKEYVFSPKQIKKSWRILVLDESSTTLLSSCLRMQEIMDTGITLVENITRKRKPYPLDAVYLLYPDSDSVDRLLRDFTTTPKQYTAAYVYFMINCPTELLNRILTSGCVKSFKALTVLHLGFLPIETHLFSIDCKDTGKLYTCPVDRVVDRGIRLERLADQIATLCIILNEFPKLRYRKRPDNLELARLVQMKLVKHKEDSPLLGHGTHKSHSVLLLLDRGFDPLTPLLHDLTLQSLIRDIGKVEGNTYKYGKGLEFELTDQDKLWKDLRNEHIADVSKSLPSLVRQFAESKKHFLTSKKKADDSLGKMGSETSGDSGSGGLVNETGVSELNDDKATSLRALQTMVREMPQYQREAANFNGVVSIADYCLDACREGINSVCAVEQDLVMGQTAEGTPLTNPMMSLVDVLKPDSMSSVDRFRLLMIFIISQGGISESNLDKLLDYAKLSLSFKSVIAAFSSVIGARLINSGESAFDSPLLRGLPNLSSDPSHLQVYLPSKGKRLHDVDDNCYALSRWSPYLQDILEKCISDTLDSQCYPYLLGANSSDLHGLSPPPASLHPNSAESSNRNVGVKGPSARFRAPSPNPMGGADAHDRGAKSLGANGHRKTGSLISGVGSEESWGVSNHCGPRLIVFVVGGVTWPEARVCYSVTQKCIETRLMDSDHSAQSRRGRVPTTPKTLTNGGGTGWNWEVVVGGTDILTPNIFHDNLKYLAENC